MIFDFRLQVFHTVARRLSFTKAAEELFITQPAVTKHIHELETQLKNKLFTRRGSNIALTGAGEILLQRTRELSLIYNRIEHEMASLAGDNKGTLKIGASTTNAQYILPPVIAGFHSKYKDIVLSLSTKNTEETEQDLLDGQIDLGFIEGHSKNKQIKYIPFLTDEIVLVAKAGHPWASEHDIKINDLKKAKLVTREHGSGTLEVIRLALKDAGLSWEHLNVEMQFDSSEAIKSYLSNSDSLAFISKYAIENTTAGQLLKIIPIRNLTIKRPLSAIHLQGQPSGLADLFLKFISRYNFR